MFKLNALLEKTDRWIIKHKKYTSTVAINITIIFFIALMLQILGIFEIQRFIDIKLFTIIVVFICIVALNKNIKDIFKSTLLLALFILTANTVFNITILNIPDYILLSSIFVLGFLATYNEKGIIHDIENEKAKEQKEERTRQNNFAKIHPQINKIPILRHVFSWMHKEGWWFSIGLLLLTLIGFGLRIYNLDYLSPMRDEYSHLVGAKRFMLEGTFNYPRASFLTYIVGIFFKLNGDTSLFLGRLPSVVFGTLAIIAIYFLAKKINKKVGIISAYLLTFSPFAVGMSRFLREYQAYFLFLILFILYLCYVIKHLKTTKLQILRIVTSPKILILALPAIYYQFIDTAAIIMPLYLISIIFILIPITIDFFKSKNKTNTLIKKRILLIGVILVLIIYIPTIFQKYETLVTFEDIQKTSEYENFLFKPDFSYNSIVPHWFSESNFNKFFAISLFILPLLFFYKNKQFMSNLLSFMAIFMVFLYLINTYFAPRYIYYAFPFYTIVFACSIYISIKLKGVFNKKQSIIYGLLIIILLTSFFNPMVVINDLKNEKDGTVDKKTGFIYRDVHQLQQYLKENNFSDKDILITANSGLFNYYYNYSFIKNETNWSLMRFDYKGEKLYKDVTTNYHYWYAVLYVYPPCKDKVCNLKEEERIKKIIQKYETGWIVIDKDRNRHWNKGFPLEDFNIGNHSVKYLGNVGSYRGFDIYRWNISEGINI